MTQQTEELRHLHEKVERCRRLARGISDPAMIVRLNILAREAEAAITVLEDAGACKRSPAVRCMQEAAALPDSVTIKRVGFSALG